MKRFLLYLLAVATIVACSKSDDVGGVNDNDTPKQPEITLNATASDFTTDGGQSEITFTSSVAWTAQVMNSRADEWCSIEPTSGPAGSAKITVTTTANDTTDDRSASIVIKAGTASKTITVSQKQKDALTVTASKFEVGAEGGEVLIEVKANIDFEYAIEESAADWVEYKATRALKTSNLVFRVKENDDTEKREAKITITSGEFSEVVTIYQESAEPSIILTKNEFAVSSSEQTIAVEVKSNVDVTVEIPNDAEWIKENTTRAFSTNTYYFDIAQNDNYDSRTAEIKFTNKENGIFETVSITQSQKDAIVASKGSYSFGKKGGDLFFKIQTNADIAVSISDDAQEWILRPTTRSMDVQSLYFEIAAYNGEDVREGLITLTGGDAVQTIKVVQNPFATTGTTLMYKSSDGNIVTPTDVSKFGATIVSNEYKDGVGVIAFDDNVTAVGEHAFDGCTTLTYIELPEGITSIGDYAFANCSAMEYISLANTITSIGNYVFENCTGEILINCDIPDAEILNGSLIGTFEKSRFTKVVISDWVTKIGSYAFYGCNSITSITIPESVTEIGISAFKNCGGELTVNCDIPDSNYGAFSNAKFTKVTIGDKVAKIGRYAFYNCSSLACDIIIPSGVKKINDYTFYNCSSITSINIPESVTAIGYRAFEGCGGKLTVNCDFHSHNVSTYIGAFDNANFTKVTIGEGITKIDKYSFSNCQYLTEVIVPSSIIEIDEFAFRGCRSLMSINIPESVTEIGRYAFRDCSSLACDIIIPSGVTKINDYTFYNCGNITSITIPESVTAIGYRAFEGCGGKLTVNCDIPDSNSSENGAFYNAKFTKVTIGNKVAKVGSYAFYGCNRITSITIPSSVTEIGRSAFNNCSSLACDIIIPSGVTKINDYTFSNCSSITSITIPSNVTEIGREAFNRCRGEVIINCNTPDTDSIFKNSEFAIVTFGDNVTDIGGKLFYNNEYIKAVTIGAGVTSIGKDAFYDCSNMHSVYCKPINPPILGDKYVFNYNAPDRKIYVPKASVLAYKASTNWSGYIDKIEGYEYDLTDDNGSLENPDNSGNDVEW